MRISWIFPFVLVGIVSTSYAQDYCDLCPSGEYATARDRPLVMEVALGGIQVTTCGELDDLIYTYLDDGAGSCGFVDEIQTTYGVDFRGYCQCPGYELSPDAMVCYSLCTNGVSNPDALVDTGLTCQMYADFILSITDSVRCGSTGFGMNDDYLALAFQGICCSSADDTFVDDDDTLDDDSVGDDRTSHGTLVPGEAPTSSREQGTGSILPCRTVSSAAASSMHSVISSTALGTLGVDVSFIFGPFQRMLCVALITYNKEKIEYDLMWMSDCEYLGYLARTHFVSRAAKPFG